MTGWAATKEAAGFLRSLQNNLKSEWSGRFLSLILAELGKREPRSFLAFLERVGAASALSPSARKALAAGEAQFDLEYTYRAKRRADVTMLVRGQPALLIEVKDRDVGHDKNAMQLEDYLHYVRHTNPDAIFVHFSRDAPSKVLPTLKAAQSEGRAFDTRFRHLYDALCPIAKKGPPSAISAIIKEYLEDIGVEAYRAINLEAERSALTFLAVQMAGFGGQNGFGRLQSAASVRRGPELLRDLLGDAAVLADWLYEDNRTAISNRPQHRFIVRPTAGRLPLRKALADAEADGDDFVEIPERAVRKASISVYAQAKIKTNGKWLYIYVGYIVGVSAVDSEAAQVALFAEVYWPTDSVLQESEWLPQFPSEHEATRLCGRLMKKAIEKACKADPDLKQSLGSVNIPAPRG